MAGCGGGGSGSGAPPSGRAVLTVIWPTGRLIPAASNSIRVQIFDGQAQVASQLLARPAGGGPATATFDPVPTGTLTVRASAYPGADGSGVAQAQASLDIAVAAGQTTPFSLTMGSTIDHVEATPTSLSVAVGSTAPLALTAKDASGNVVLINAGTVQWASGNTNLVTVDGSGLVHAVLPTGPTPVQVTGTESESGRSVSVPVTVTSSTAISIAPTPVNVSVGHTQVFAATVTGAPDTSVTYTVTEAGGGTVTAGGLYTAPATSGTYHVVATSRYDPAKSATATITVQSGSANVIIQ